MAVPARYSPRRPYQNADFTFGAHFVNAMGIVHDRMVFGRRVKVLAEHLAALIPPGARVLDVGCGDGMLDRVILQKRADVTIEGIDVLVRTDTHIAVKRFDGLHIPHPDASFDAVMIVDVLHHTDDPEALLREAKRVGKVLIIKDHYAAGPVERITLRFMDWVGNAPHGVKLPYNYWSKQQWELAFEGLSLRSDATTTALGLYPPPASWVFERELHFVTRVVSS